MSQKTTSFFLTYIQLIRLYALHVVLIMVYVDEVILGGITDND